MAQIGSISAPCNVKQAISNLLIELEEMFIKFVINLPSGKTVRQRRCSQECRLFCVQKD